MAVSVYRQYAALRRVAELEHPDGALGVVPVDGADDGFTYTVISLECRGEPVGQDWFQQHIPEEHLGEALELIAIKACRSAARFRDQELGR